MAVASCFSIHVLAHFGVTAGILHCLALYLASLEEVSEISKPVCSMASSEYGDVSNYNFPLSLPKHIYKLKRTLSKCILLTEVLVILCGVKMLCMFADLLG